MGCLEAEGGTAAWKGESGNREDLDPYCHSSSVPGRQCEEMALQAEGAMQVQAWWQETG